MVNHFIVNIFLSWVFGAVICDMYNSIDVHASTVSPFCYKLRIHIFAILWRMKSDLSSLFKRMSRLGVSFLPKPHTQFVSRNGTEVSQKTISADRQTSCKDLYLDYQGRGKFLRLILGEHSSLVLYQPGPLLRNCQAFWLPLLHEHQVVVHLFKALLWWKIIFKHLVLSDLSLIIAWPCQ